MQKGNPFPLRRLRVCARNDGYGLELVILALEIKVSLTLLDALNAALQLVQELRVDVLEVVFDALPALGGDFGRGVVDQILAQSEDGIGRAVALDEARHTEFHEVLARATQTVASRAEARDEIMVKELIDDVAQGAVVANLELLAVQVLVLLLVAVLFLFLVVVFVVANLQVGAAVDLRDAGKARPNGRWR